VIQKNKLLIIGLAGAGVVLAGCGDESDVDLEVNQEALTSENGLAVNGLAVNGLAVNGLAVNGLAVNGLAVNGLAVNGLAVNGLAVNGLAVNGLAVNGLAVNGLADPAAHAFMTYLVSCALPAGRSVTYPAGDSTTTLVGEIGLAPSWEHQSCDLTCQRWVSACILARVNHLGVHREISMRGDNKALAIVPHELQLYTEAEATYYGNLFQNDKSLYACMPRGAKGITRVCGDSLSDCPMAVVGFCPDVCEQEGKFRTYLDCASQPASRNKGSKSSRDKLYHETISIFLVP
jgi:hypothetical protein